jgi:hypothetical protein
VRGVAIENWGVTVTNLTRVVHDDDLGGEVGGTLSWIILGVRGNVSSLKILDSNILDIESNIVTGKCLKKRKTIYMIAITSYRNRESGGLFMRHETFCLSHGDF